MIADITHTSIVSSVMVVCGTFENLVCNAK